MARKGVLHRSTKQEPRFLLCSFMHIVKILLLLAGFVPQALAIPPNTPISNTVQVDYTSGGAAFQADDTVTVFSDPASGNSPPHEVLLNPAQVAENDAGALVGIIAVTDLDPSDTHTLTVSDPRFVISGSELRLAPGVSVDFEAEATIALTITATDPAGGSIDVPLTVTVLNVNEAPTEVTLSSTTFDANTPGAIVGGLTTVDPDNADTHTYTVDDARFEVVNGELKLLDGESFPLGTTVTLTITSTDSGGLSIDTIFTVTSQPPGGGGANDAGITLSQFGSSPLSQPTAVAVGQCLQGGATVPLVNPVTAFGQSLALPDNLDLQASGILKSGDALFVQVADPDANQDSAAADTVTSTLLPGSGDVESILLTETGNDTGIFVGYIQTVSGSAVANDCVLQVSPNDPVTVQYTDPTNPADTAVANILVDPFGLVFDAATGQAVNGALVTLVDGSGVAAQVFADDGIASYPNVVTSGDGQGGTGVGQYRFPFVASGDYQLQVVPPNRFRFPSQVADGDIQSLPAAPFALSAGSRGNVFNVPVGPALQIDIPLDVLPVVPSPSSLELRRISSAGGSFRLATSQCDNGTGLQASGPAVSLSAGTITTPANIGTETSSRFVRGDAVVVELIDPDQDLDPFAPDVVTVTITAGADIEEVQLTETNDSTGVFTGFMQTAVDDVVVARSCVLEAPANTDLTVSYTDPDDGSDQASAQAILDPIFQVFASDTGRLLNGAEITLLDAATDLPAAGSVFAADGVTAFPATVTSGGTVTDGSGVVTNFPAGSFNFPVIAPGDYRLLITPPVSYEFPSTASDDDLAPLGFRVASGSRGEVFTVVTGLAQAFDVPLDPVQVEVFVSKEANKDVVGIGDFIGYAVTAENSAATDVISDARFVDLLPVGFRYVEGSATAAGSVLDAASVQVGVDGRQLTIELGALGAGETRQVKYVAEVTAGAQTGSARNQVRLDGIGVGSSNVAFADVVVQQDLFTETTFIVGQVVTAKTCPGDGDYDADELVGVSGVRVWLENGTFVVTDQQGKYHFQGLTPGTHVVQMDTATLPIGLTPKSCRDSTAFAGSAISQFVDLQAGSLWRADFFVAPEALEQQASYAFSAEHGDQEGRLNYRLSSSFPAQEISNIRVTTMVDEAMTYVPGSAKLNGVAIDDPRGIEMGALSFRLPDTEVKGDYELSFAVDSKGATTPGGEAQSGEAKTVVMFKANGEGVRSEVLAVDGVGSAQAHTQLAPSKVQHRRNVPYELPEQEKSRAPEFSLQWIAARQNDIGIVWPPERHNPSMPAIEVAVLHPTGIRPHLLVDKELVNPLTLQGSKAHKSLGLSLTTWEGVPISESGSWLNVQFESPDGSIEQVDELRVHYSGAPVRAELLKDRSYLVADGLHPPAVAVRFYDQAGYPLRAGTTGEFSISPPYQALDKTKHLENLSNEFTNHKYRVLEDGVAFIQLEPTMQTGEVELKFRFDAVRSEVLRARLAPGQRDWIMVGLLEGSYSHRELDGNLDGLAAANLDDENLTDGRMAFYAKGTVRGDWLLTVAYDTDKKVERQLRSQIDPNRFYTLYGDGTDQLYDAESQRKLYLKAERGAFAGLFGDFDTEFQKSQLARYERRMNGLSGGYYGDKWEAKAFLSDTRQGFVRDEIQGDGTSGVYRLSRARLVRNSESIKLVTRDRFSPTEVISEVALTRFIDYTIDYNRGTLIFRSPVVSQDENFNPTFIEAEYEVENDNGEDLVGGVRLAYRLDDADSELAVTYVRDETVEGGELLAADFTWQVNDEQKITLEYAQSDSWLEGSGDAYLAEFEHNGERWAGRAYARQSDGDFGLGHQSSFEQGVRQIGVEGEYKHSDSLRVTAQAFQQTLLQTDASRDVVEAQIEHQQGGRRIHGGLRAIQEETQGPDANAQQVTGGISQDLLNNRLNIRLDAELDASSSADNVDYPSRLVLGGEYRLFGDVSVIGEQEYAWSDARDASDTRIGLRSRPWQGADINTMFHRQQGEQGERLFATTGVMQQWRVAERWLFDLGLDQSNTLNESNRGQEPDQLLANPFNPPASGSFGQDFAAYYLGAGYQHEAWNIATRLERHEGDLADKWNFLAGANRQLQEGRVVSGSLAVLLEELSNGGVNDMADLRFGIAWRPSVSRFTFLNRTDLIFAERKNGLFNTRSRKWVNNTGINYKNDPHQLSLHLGVKYVVEDIDGFEYDGVTGAAGLEYRYHFAPRWDLGLHASILESFESRVRKESYGFSIGYRALENSWLSIGYNFAGFDDDDFIAADYSAQGIFIKFRLKFDQYSGNRFLQFANLSGESVEPANGR